MNTENEYFGKANKTALKGRKIKAQGNALCKKVVPEIAPRLCVNYGDYVAWGKIN